MDNTSTTDNPGSGALASREAEQLEAAGTSAATTALAASADAPSLTQPRQQPTLDDKFGDAEGRHAKGGVIPDGPESTTTVGRQRAGSSGRLKAFAPTLGKMAVAAHKMSAPYLSYAAQASQEAARYTAGHAKKYVDKVQGQHRRGEAPPGQIDSAKVDWSGVGARFCSLSWYERQLVENHGVAKQTKSDNDNGKTEGSSVTTNTNEDEAEDAGNAPAPATLDDQHDVGFGSGDGGREGQSSVMATLKDLDPWVTSPLFDDECNAMDSLGAMVAGRPPFAGVGSDDSSASSCGVGTGAGSGLRDCPSPVRVLSPDGLLLDRLCESWEADALPAMGSAAETGGSGSGATAVAAPESNRPFDSIDKIAAGKAQCLLLSSQRRQQEHSAPTERVGADTTPGSSGVQQASTVLTATGTGSLAVHTNSQDHPNLQEAEGDAGVGSAAGSVPTSAATPPPLPSKPARVTAAFLKDSITATGPHQEHVAQSNNPLGSGAGDAATMHGGGAQVPGYGDVPAGDGGGAIALGTVSSQDLLLDWLRREASAGDEEAQFHLAQLFSPPRFEMKAECRECGEAFGVTRYRHHCRHCGGSFCHEHAWHEHPIPKLGLPAPQRVCTPCKHTLEVEDWRERVEWRLERVNAYLEQGLIQYFDTGVDTAGDKALRVVDGAIFVAKAAPLGTAVKVSVEVMDVLMKYGTAGVAGLVLRREFVEAVEVLKRLSGVDKKWPMSVHEMTAAMYYLLAQRRGERGAEPNGEHIAHQGCPVISDEELNFLRRMAALPLHFAYTKTALELQVLCNTTGWSLVFHKPESRFHQPAFSLLACRTTMTAALVVRGTGSVHDVITDIQAIPVPFPPQRGDGGSGDDPDGWSEMPPADTVACCGMARAAEWLQREVVHHLVKLHREGHKIVLLGHSLGGGVAALLGCLVKEVIPDVRVVAFATPACADIGVSKLCEGVCTSVVLHDDVVPRVTPQAVRALLKDALCTKEGWVKHLYDDWDAIVGRAKGLWAPRWRTPNHGATGTASAIPGADTSPSSANLNAQAVAMSGKHSSSRGKEQGKTGRTDPARSSSSGYTLPEKQGSTDPTEADGFQLTAPSAADNEESAGNDSDEWGGRGKRTPASTATPGATTVFVNAVTTPKGGDGEPSVTSVAASSKKRWTRGSWATMDVRAVQSRISRIVDDTSARIRSSVVVNPPQAESEPVAVALPGNPFELDGTPTVGDSAAGGVYVGEGGGRGKAIVGDGAAETGLASSEEEAEVVDELPLPELFVPGRIVHIYSQRGVYRGCEIPRDHECMRTIPMYGNMLADHASQAYFDALEEIAAVRVAEAKGEVMPEWVPYSASEECQLCKADFSWASTSRSEAQRMRDKHNCRMCGLLVCDPCSRHRKPMPRVGVLDACRVCDRCFYGANPSKLM